MKVGDLVIMNFDGWSDEEIANYGGWQGWGTGVVMALPDKIHDYCHVIWSKAGSNWEAIGDLEKVSER